MQSYSEPTTAKHERSKFLRQTEILMWKSYLQRQRRWRTLVVETGAALVLFLVAVVIARPVFLTPIQEEPTPPLDKHDLYRTLHDTQYEKIIGYAPNQPPFSSIMARAERHLNIKFLAAESEDDLNNLLYKISKQNNAVTEHPRAVIWVIWKPKVGHLWRFSIRSTERAKFETGAMRDANLSNPHLGTGFLALQYAISEAIVHADAAEKTSYKIVLEAMPVSPLMIESQVSQALSRILLCFTLAFIPPIIDTEALVVYEALTQFKRALRMHCVEYSSMYVGWLVYAYLSAAPVCLLAAITITLIFRWIHIATALLLVIAYCSVMIMLALIMAMFHNRAWLACVWTTLFTLLQLYLAELLVHHKYNTTNNVIAFILQLAIPPLGLVNTFNQFALHQTTGESSSSALSSPSLTTITLMWGGLILFYFSMLMLLQRTIGRERAIGGQVSWKSIIFKKAEDKSGLHPIRVLSGRERDRLQEVDELVAKAISFHSVSKCIMGNPVLNNVTLDIYRGEFTMIFSEQVQKKMVNTFEDLLTGLAWPDSGSINVLGHIQSAAHHEPLMNMPHMMGYCHLTKFLIPDLTVEEHFTLFCELCLWNESRHYMAEYGMVRQQRLMAECELQAVRGVRVRDLHHYYRSQLCWAIAVLLEPRIVIVPYFIDHPVYKAVIKDKIVKFKGKMTIVKMCFSTLQLEFADRVFIFDSKVLVFGGTPAFLFFKYGREYRVRLTVRCGAGGGAGGAVSALAARAAAAGGSVRAHLGTMLILRLPAHPATAVARFVEDITRDAAHYGITSLHISVPDTEEVYNRAIYESRRSLAYMRSTRRADDDTMQRIAAPVEWHRTRSYFCSIIHLKYIGRKFWKFYVHHRFVLILTVLSAIVTGLFIGLSFSTMLNKRERDKVTHSLLRGELLVMESLRMNTTLILRVDNSSTSMSMANAYVLSEPNYTSADIQSISYTALHSSEDLTEYLVTRAIDSPQLYVFEFAYGMDVFTHHNKTIQIKALYSPVHRDYGAAARSLAKVFTALLRHYSSHYNATIQVTDDPLGLDLTPWMPYARSPSLFTLCLLILSISHMTLIPSMEHGLIRHTQSHAYNFSPARYWLSLYVWDVVLYGLMVMVMSGVMVLMVYLVAPSRQFRYIDLYVIPLMLCVYGVACVPHAYLFSLGSRVALNTMTYIIVNIIFGEETILARIFYGDIFHVALWFMSLSPPYNMAYSFVKIKEIFLYNSECIVYEMENLCSSKTFHRCCEKCGIVQECFERKAYFSFSDGILRELVCMLSTAGVFLSLLMVVEYRVGRRLWLALRPAPADTTHPTTMPHGVQKEIADVADKCTQIKEKRNNVAYNTFGEYLVAQNICKTRLGTYLVHGVHLGVGRGEALAVSGLARHGRLDLCKILAGYQCPTRGSLYCMSRWSYAAHPHNYARHVSVCCEEAPLPPWMTVRSGLMLVAGLRGVPRKHLAREVDKYIEALELVELQHVLSGAVEAGARARVHLAAAVVGAPPLLVLDECTAYQKFSVQRSMYHILHTLRKRGHAILISSSSVESHMPVSSRLAIILDGTIYDIDSIDNLVVTYSNRGYTVVVHLKDELDVAAMFAQHFTSFTINDSTDVLVNVQVYDADLTWASLFKRMETMVEMNDKVYSYVISAVPMNYIYNSILQNEKGMRCVTGLWWSGRGLGRGRGLVEPRAGAVEALRHLPHKYHITRLNELPWSVMFHT